MTSLAPKWLNIKRGQLIACTIGVWGFAPWKVLDSAENFVRAALLQQPLVADADESQLTFMSSYSIVLAPLAGLMAVDFFIVKKGKYDVYELYKPDGIYRYFGGWNWRSYTALLVAVALNLPGMINAIQPTVEIGNIYYLYMLSNVTGVSRIGSAADSRHQRLRKHDADTHQDFIAITLYLLLNRFFPAYDSLVEEPIHDVAEYHSSYGAAAESGAARGYYKEKTDEAVDQRVVPAGERHA
jgi:NCS1 family nucleobase:cation symporter-1